MTLDAAVERLLAGDPEALADPFPTWRRLREAAPVHRLGRRVLATGHAEVKALCRDASPRYALAYADSAFARDQAAALPADQARAYRAFWRFEASLMPSRCGDDHTRLRQAVASAFTPRRVERLRGSVERIVDELLADPVVDVMPLAHRLPLYVVGDLLGLPRSDAERIERWTAAISACFGDGVEPTTVVAGHEAVLAFGEHLRRQDGDGLLAELAERVEPDELTALGILLVFAGHETTTNLIGHGLHQLLLRRDQWRLLCEQPDRWPAAIDELLRFTTPVQYVARPVAEPHALGGLELEVGDVVYPILAAANRDPAAFADPETLDVARSDARAHLSFGHGEKFCLGGSLARLEAATFLAALARRHPELRLAPGRLRCTGGPVLRRLAALPVTP